MGFGGVFIDNVYGHDMDMGLVGTYEAEVVVDSRQLADGDTLPAEAVAVAEGQD